MRDATQNYERLTISLPIKIAKEIDSLKKELKLSRSEILKIAVENYLYELKKDKLKNVAEIMAVEYKTNKELTAFTAIDGEDFK